MKLFADSLELRGIEKKQSKNGNAYLLFYLEEPSGNPCKVVCREDIDVTSLKKGQLYKCVFDFNSYGNLNLISLES